MKTTLRENTIETLQRQPAWKEYIDALVDSCNHLFDGMFIDKSGVLVDKDVKVNPDDETTFDNSGSQYAYPSLSYKANESNERGLSLNLQENLSFRGLLRTLSLYGCKIDNIETSGSLLPHTYKTEGGRKQPMFGYDTTDMSYDFEVMAMVDDVYNKSVDYDVNDNDEVVGDFKYKNNIYGYNQKYPVISKSPVREVFGFYKFTSSSETRPDIYALMNDVTIIHQGSSVHYTIDTDVLYKSAPDNENGVVKATDVSVSNLQTNYSLQNDDVFYKFIIDANNTSYIINNRDVLDIINADGRIIYNVEGNEYNNVCFSTSNKDIVQRINLTYKMTIGQTERYRVFEESVKKRMYIVLDITSDYYHSNPIYLSNPLFVDDCTLFTQPFFLYENGDKVAMCANMIDTVGGENNITYEIETHDLKEIDGGINQIDNTSVSKKADGVLFGNYYYKWNMYEKKEYYEKAIPKDNDNPEALGWYEKVSNGYSLSNYTDITPNHPIANGNLIYWYEKDENNTYTRTTDTSFNSNKTYYEETSAGVYSVVAFYVLRETSVYIDDVYTAFISSEIPPKRKGWYVFNGTDYVPTNDNAPVPNVKYYKKTGEEYTLVFDNNMGWHYFFDGKGNVFYFGNNYDNETKTIGKYVFKNAHTLEYFETMYFNHFIKAYPVTDTQQNGVFSTNRICCDLDLVRFADSVPYVVSYDREGTEGLDCVIFSKILSYNKHTHLITLDTPVWFENSSTPKYVVVAYQNVSPFNKIRKMKVSAPDDATKDIVKSLLGNFTNQYCTFEIKSESGLAYEMVN